MSLGDIIYYIFGFMLIYAFSYFVCIRFAKATRECVLTIKFNKILAIVSLLMPFHNRGKEILLVALLNAFLLQYSAIRFMVLTIRRTSGIDEYLRVFAGNVLWITIFTVFGFIACRIIYDRIYK